MAYRRRYETTTLIGTLPLIIISLALLALQILSLLGNSDIEMWGRIASPVFYTISAIAATVACRQIGTIKNNLLLPTFFIYLISGTLGASNGWWQGFACSTVIFLIWAVTISLPKEGTPVWWLFYIMFCLAIASFIDMTVVLLIPVYLYGLGTYNKLDFRGVMASALGFGFFYGLLFPVAFLSGHMDLLTNYMAEHAIRFSFINLRTVDIISYSIIGGYTLIAFLVFLAHYHDNKIYVRSTYLFSYLLLLSEILLCMLAGARNLMEPAIITMLGVLLSIHVDANNTRISKILFYTLLSTLVILFIAKYFLL